VRIHGALLRGEMQRRHARGVLQIDARTRRDQLPNASDIIGVRCQVKRRATIAINDATSAIRAPRSDDCD
jgi:hypothetical protein